MSDLATIVAEMPHTMAADDTETPVVGRWFWYQEPPEPEADQKLQGGKYHYVKDTPPAEPVLCCVVRIGSNYVKLQSPADSTVRVHNDVFWDQCTFEPNAERYMAAQVQVHQKNVHGLLEEVRGVTARLAISVEPALPGAAAAQDGQALALYACNAVESYEKSLVLAKTETLPELFSKIKEEQAVVVMWLNAQIIPLQAETDKMQPAISKITERIASVSLYAGLEEHVVCVREGTPAETSEPVHVFQRKAFMDEECLAQYETGGMDIKNLEGFDRWLTRPANLERLLPFKRCIVAFQVRRNPKVRPFHTVADYFKVCEEEKLDAYTYLYVRNGDAVYRVRTEIEFDDHLFPDQESNILDGKVYYDSWQKKLISATEYASLVAAAQEEDRKNQEAPKKDKWMFSSDTARRALQHVVLVTPATVYYDDALVKIQAEMMRHNRMVLVLQGLLDRSMVLHPHPPWQLWSPEGFQMGLRLIYDGVRVLSDGPKPDFEAYRAALNAKLVAGSITLGQQYVWYFREARREHEEQRRRYPDSRYGRYDEDKEDAGVNIGGHARSSDPGPGQLARVFSKTRGGFEFRWVRSARNIQKKDVETPDRITVPADRLFNVSAYRPGDIKQFFNDPRTRAEYLQWAPVLILAEEYAAGNLKVQEPALPPPPKPKGPIDEDAQYRRQLLKRKKAMVGQAVALKREVTLKNGKRYDAGSLWRVQYLERNGTFYIRAIQPNGEVAAPDGEYTPCIRGMDHYELIVQPGIPAAKDDDK